LIRKAPGFQPLFASIPKKFISHFEISVIPPGNPIIVKGERNPYIYMLCSGKMRIINVFDNARIFSFATKEGPGFSGLLEFLSGEDLATSTVETASECHFLKMRKQVFQLWMEEDIQAFRFVVRAFARQLYPSLNSVGALYVHPRLYVLVQHLVTHYAHEAEKNGEALVLSSRESLAEELGFSLRTMYRLSNRLVEKGFITIRKKKMVLTREGVRLMRVYLENETYE
jgi:CRP-like cAMP-binding protein